MKLSDFIQANADQILDAWEKFAAGISPERHLSTAQLRDHASGMLSAIVADLNCAQTPLEQIEKSKGRAPRSARDTYAEMHGLDRESSGFGMNDTMSEFRALRANIIKMWVDSSAPGSIFNDEFTRFNEAIDQAITESLQQYATDLGRYIRLFHTLLSTPPDLNCIFDVDGKIIYANESFANFYEIPVVKIVGKNFFDFCISNASEFRRWLQHVIDTKDAYRGEISSTTLSENEVTHDYLFVPVMNYEGNVESIVATARDITERKKLNEKINKSANYDVLTGLTNRSLFRDRLGWEVNNAENTGLPIALFFIDIDGFKEVNDLLGHNAGDLLLQQTAQRISSCLRSVDTVARIGGDEFTVILSAVNRTAHVDVLAQKIVDEIARPFRIVENDVCISCSIGITLYPQDGTTSESLVRNADQAMYAAKKSGRGRFSFFNAGMRDSAWTRLKMIKELRYALPQDQLVVYYQPIVHFSTGLIVKAEALLRWNHPLRGLVVSKEFIGLAEEIDLIGEIDDWVFGEAVTRMREWSALIEAPFQISVNKSPIEFTVEAPTKNLNAYLEASKLDKSSICIEITEGVLLNDSPSVRETLNNLQKGGIQLAIDDFGTGYASMAFLNKFKVDYLKIDQSFVQNTTANVNSRIFAETIIVMAHKLGLEVIAEGVETVEQKDWLKAAGCDYGQGYFFSRPVSSRDFEKLLKLNKSA